MIYPVLLLLFFLLYKWTSKRPFSYLALWHMSCSFLLRTFWLQTRDGIRFDLTLVWVFIILETVFRLWARTPTNLFNLLIFCPWSDCTKFSLLMVSLLNAFSTFCNRFFSLYQATIKFNNCGISYLLT